MPEKLSLAEKTAERMIYEFIESGKVESGGKLPNEMELSSLLGVSRITLREAIRILSAQGYVKVQRGRGTFVTDKTRLGTDFDFIHMENQSVEFRDLVELRSCVEPAAAYLASQRATEEDAVSLLGLADKIYQKYEKDMDTMEEEIAFHSMVAKVSGNAFFKQLIPVLVQAVIETFEYAKKNQNDTEYYMVEHRQIAEAIQTGNADKAKLLMELHMMTFDK